MMKLHKKYTALLVLVTITALVSCSEEEDLPEPVIVSSILETQYGHDIIADTGDAGRYTYYNLEDNQVVPISDSSSTNWDLAFKGTSILTNNGTSGPGGGGAIIENGIFDEIIEAPSDGYAVDELSGLAIPTGSNNGWYFYTSTNVPEHAILPLAGKIILLRTADGNYAKVEVLSYYEGNPNTTTTTFADLNTRAAGRFYSIKYVYQPDGTTKLN